jgi:hypothetical protein
VKYTTAATWTHDTDVESTGCADRYPQARFPERKEIIDASWKFPEADLRVRSAAAEMLFSGRGSRIFWLGRPLCGRHGTGYDRCIGVFRGAELSTIIANETDPEGDETCAAILISCLKV